jgi:hypothetical protein
MPETRTTADQLLDHLEPLPYPRRVRETARRAAELAATGELAGVIAELDARGAYERGVAALLACVGRDTDWAATHLADPDPFVRGHAMRAAQGLPVPDAAFETALHDAPAVVRAGIVRHLAAGRRPALADRLVGELRERWGDTEAATLLPGCSQEVVARLLPQVFHAVRGWSALARRHPGILLDTAERELAALPDNARTRWFEHHVRVLTAVAPTHPRRVLDLLDSYPPDRLPHRITSRLAVLAKADPGRVLRWYTGPGRRHLPGPRRMSPSALYTLARSGAPELDAYAHLLAADPDDLAALLAAQAPADRWATYETARAGRGTERGGVHTALLDVLPRRHVAAVAREGARTAREQGDDWLTVLTAESYLPPEEAQETLSAATRRPRAEERAAVWPLYVRHIARTHDPAAATALAEEVATRLRNEQDPVRGAALRALADDVHPRLWTPSALPHLGRLVTDALQARDRSYVTSAAVSRLALGILREHAAGSDPEHTAWALDTLTALNGHSGGIDLGRLDRTLRRGQEHDVHAALRPRIESDAAKREFGLVLALARATGRRAADMPALQDELRQAVDHGNDATVRAAVPLWLEARATRDARVAHVLDLDPSTVELDCVADIVGHRRTDLLAPFLTDRPPLGRFLTSKATWAFPAGSAAVRRWTPHQRQAYLRQLERVVGDAATLPWRRAHALHRAAHVPDLGFTLVRKWAASPDVVLAEAALAALGGSADELPLLFEQAGGDRARVAVYAASRAARQAAPSRLTALFDDLLTGPGKKITSRKEGARLAAGCLPAPEAARLLARAYAAPDSHRDVRAACVALAARGLLGQEPAWEMLADAVHEDRPAVLRNAALRPAPLDVAEAHRERYAALVTSVAGTGHDELAATALAALTRWAPWSPQAPELFARVLADVPRRAPSVWRTAATGLVDAAARTPRGAAALHSAVTALVEHGADPDAGEERDRPAHRRIEHVADLLAERTPRTPALRPAARSVALLLAGHDTCVAPATRVLLAAVDLTAPGPGLRELAGLHTDRPALAARTADRLRSRLGREETPEAELDRAAQALTAAGTPAEGLFAWAITVARGERTAWPTRWRAHLATLRRHPSPDVRDAARRSSTAQGG